MSLDTLLTFGIAFLVFAASPGPDNLTILSKTIARGPAYGLAYGSGVMASIAGFVILSALGLNALASFASENLRVVQYVGAGYLIYTGVAMWRSSGIGQPRQISGSLPVVFLTGFLLNVTNPKMPIFYLALLPGVLGVQGLYAFDLLKILAVIGVVEVAVIGGHVLLASRARRLLAGPKRLRVVNRSAGSLMIGAGVVVAAR